MRSSNPEKKCKHFAPAHIFFLFFLFFFFFPLFFLFVKFLFMFHSMVSILFSTVKGIKTFTTLALDLFVNIPATFHNACYMIS